MYLEMGEIAQSLCADWLIQTCRCLFTTSCCTQVGAYVTAWREMIFLMEVSNVFHILVHPSFQRTWAKAP